MLDVITTLSTKVTFILQLYSYCFLLWCQGGTVERGWTVNHTVGGSSPSWVKLTKSLQQAFNPKIAGTFGLRPKLGGPVYSNNIMSTLKIHLCLTHKASVKAVSPGNVVLCIPSDYADSYRIVSPLIYCSCLTQAAQLGCSHSHQ